MLQSETHHARLGAVSTAKAAAFIKVSVAGNNKSLSPHILTFGLTFSQKDGD